jgi:GT2 family glycosyltransferase
MDTIEPAISPQLLEDDDETGAVQIAPPVVAVVVTSDPGPWLEEALTALAGQDYPSLSVLVLDNGSVEDPTARIAAAMPGAFVRRRAERAADGLGFPAAANEALDVVEGATFLLFCHDDVTPDRDAVRLMVEEAYRSNAGIVGPKFVHDDHPEILLEVGMSVDRYGVPFSGIEPDEVDQEQHDAVRDVFFVSNAAMLVRADLFHELSGFDPATFPGADDVDLCWRARLAGARVIVVPAARVRHRQSTTNETRPPAALEPQDVRAKTRSRIRVLCKSYSGLSLLWVLPTAFILGLAEVFGLLLTGRVRRGAALLAGWLSAFAHPGELRRARVKTQRLRRVDDGDVRDLMIRGSARLRALVTSRLHAGEHLTEVSSRTRVRMQSTARQLRRAPAVVGTVLVVLVLFGSRSLFFGRVPQVGDFQAWPGAGAAWATFAGSWRMTFMGSEHAATPAFGLISMLDAVLLGHGGLARSLVVAGALPLGAWGTYRLVRPFAVPALPAVAATVAYAANPIARNAIWRGELGPLVCFAVAPFVLGAFVRAMDDHDDPPARPHPMLTVGLLVAVAASVWPPALMLALLIGLACCITTPFIRDARTALRAAPLAAGATGIAVLLCTPWVWSLLGAESATLGLQPRDPLSLGAILHFETGRAGAGLAPWGIVAAAAVPLAIATGTRLAWATRAWMLAVCSFALVWLPGRVSPGASVPAPEGVLVGAAIGLAFACGLGVAAVLDDLRSFGFGWRQVMTVVATVGVGWAMLGLTADTWSGRWGLDAEDWASTYAWMETNPPAGGFRVLWVGDPNILPADAKRVGTTGFALTRDGPGDARAQWAAPEERADRVLARAIDAATSGQTSRLGHLLAPPGIRYVAFVTRAAPSSGARGTPQPRLADALARQLDLTLSRVETNGTVYQNDAWLPVHALAAPGAPGVEVDERDPLASALRTEPADVVGVPTSGAHTGPIGPGTLLWSEAASKKWHATSDGRALTRRDAFGWTNAFTVDARAPVAVHFRGGAIGKLLRWFEVLCWAGVVAGWFVTRRRVRAHRA